MPTSPTRVENTVAGYCASYWRYEFQIEDVMLFRDLARSPSAVASLRATTDDNPTRSTRFRELLEPLGYDDELRAVVRFGERAWGLIDLFRDRGRPPFSPRDIAAVAGLAGTLGSWLADVVTQGHRAGDVAPSWGPGAAMLGADGEITALDESAERWFAELAGPRWADDEAFLGPMSALVARAASVAAGRDRGPARAHVQTMTGRWLVAHASVLRGRDAGNHGTSLVIEPAMLGEVAPILVEAFGLTAREREITCAVGRGHANAQIAQDLVLSQHTVRDHLKAIFAKVGVSSRGELVAMLFADQRPVGPHAMIVG
ncbi:helix-turn-helix transcriptional regulator [Actinomycetospora sp. NBRC 106375]|uniref:helix-turn-helix transcriptional regulator n=1 Tax=Actinomycetospora sp. NBRC 106375 TaxID=3032207 RepID=UPI002553F161|nr:helix-turn-helix transcriptional regulator [Actinomycetospora sp. NBRC 106375]